MWCRYGPAIALAAIALAHSFLPIIPTSSWSLVLIIEMSSCLSLNERGKWVVVHDKLPILNFDAKLLRNDRKVRLGRKGDIEGVCGGNESRRHPN